MEPLIEAHTEQMKTLRALVEFTKPRGTLSDADDVSDERIEAVNVCYE